tara:strand:+ start:192 stop:308 length:117 start_codon:yes stop_codon:yes gene_type:complete
VENITTYLKAKELKKKGGRDTCPLFYVQSNLTKEESYG